MSRAVSPDDVDPAVRGARRVVGLYGDPGVSWSIVLGADLDEPLDPDPLQRRLETVVTLHPHLGRPGTIARFPDARETTMLGTLAGERYGDRSPLVRVALAEDGRRLLVAAHHGAIDGLGMLGLLAALLGAEVTSEARGVASDSERGSFVAAGVRRLAEALVRPPRRVAARRARSGAGDELVSRVVTGPGGGSAALLLSTCRAVRRWNDGAGARVSPLVVAMGLSRRPGSPTPAPDRDTAYVRLPADGILDAGDARGVLDTVRPEPAFPVSDGGGLAPRLIALLSGRLGATVLLSNLGRVHAPGVRGLDFWPVPTGPAGVAVGLATVAGEVRLTVRARHDWFAADSTGRLADLLAEELQSRQ